MSDIHKTFPCPACGFHYRDEDTAKKCEAWCKEHGACSAEITKLSIERTPTAPEVGCDDGVCKMPPRPVTPAEAGAQYSKKTSEEKCAEGVCKMPPRGEKESTSAKASADDAQVELEHRWKRALADYQNLQKEVARERMEMGAYAVLRVVERFLPVVDNLKTAMSHAPSTVNGQLSTVDQWAVGVGFIQKQLDEAMKDLGLTPIKTVGEKFDATKHEAVGEEVAEGKEAGTILKEVQAGYEVLGKVVRPAKVITVK